MHFYQFLEYICGLDTKHRGRLSETSNFVSNRPSFGHHGPLAEIKLDLKTGQAGMFIACVEISFSGLLVDLALSTE